MDLAFEPAPAPLEVPFPEVRVPAVRANENCFNCKKSAPWLPAYGFSPVGRPAFICHYYMQFEHMCQGRFRACSNPTGKTSRCGSEPPGEVPTRIFWLRLR